VQRLRGIIELRRSGLSLEEVTGFIQLKRRHGTGAAAARAMAAALDGQLSAVGKRIAELKRIHDELEYWRTALAVCGECRRNVQRSNVCSECPRFPSGDDEDAALIDLWRHG
jgi:DNA-binding transcriptional MerR regulator